MMLSKNAAPGLRGLELVAVIGAWLVGIVLESWLPLPGFALLCGACSALVFIILLWRDKQGRLVMLIILWLLLTAHSSPGVFASMVFPGITVNSSGGNPIIAALYHLRTVLATLISQSLPQPEAALLIAILL